MSFWGELKRRNVFKVGVAYAVVAWLLAQIVSLGFQAFQMPQWTVTFVVSLLIIGFPLILLFAWAFEITPEGIKRTRQVPLDKSITHATGENLDQRDMKTGAAPRVAELAPTAAEEKGTPKTIAVLPFVDLSPEKDQGYFVDGLSEELLNCLTKISDLRVTSRTSSFVFKDSNKKLKEIATDLGVAHILEGSVRKSGNALRITAQLIRAEDDVHLWSKSYNRELQDIFTIQEEIATAVANELKVTLGVGESLKQAGSTENVEAYEHYLIAQGQENRLEFAKAIESAESAIGLDPNFALAWALKANAHSGLTVFGTAGRAASELDAALNATERAIELEPNLAHAHCLLGWIKTNKGEWIQAGSEYRKALALPAGTLSGSEYLIAFHYHAVGYFKKANGLLKETLQNDPLHQLVRAQYLVNLALLGDTGRAEDEYEHGLALFGNQWPLGDLFITQLRFGSGDIVYGDIVFSNEVYNSVKAHLDSPKEGLSQLHRIYTNDDNLSSEDLGQIAICAAFFGDTEFAMNAMEKLLSIQTSYFWFPVFKGVRRLPRFKEFVRGIGLVDYWNKFGWPDLCHPTNDGDFVCD